MRYHKKNRLRKSTKYSLIFLSIILLIFSVSDLINNLQKDNQNTIKKEIYKYTDKFNYDYKINLVKNKYLTDTDIENKNLAYVTDLIDNIDIDLKYDYLGSKQSNLKSSYSIIGKMQAFYNKSGEEQKIWDKEEILLEEQVGEISSDKLNINEHLRLDLKDKNKLLNEFKQQLGMTIDAKFTIMLKINILTDVEGKEISDEFTPVININLAEKTTKLAGENNIEKTEYISKEIKITEGQKIGFIILDLVMLIVAAALLRYALVAKVINQVRNEFKYELNRILKICQDKIVEISTKPNDEGREIIFVKDFGEIVKISEELFKPILCYKDKNYEEAWFTVVSEKTSYRYILKK